ncbi:VirK family protein [Streptomyces sp. NBC_01476]|uniref:hypothetical protein n=1 Tax=Streptomyces sp. NBC_01476 TaxID=2903881 RepID=UPI002E354DED|nr:hypothetical protein [Streptomyces sp. NBC_01476]
MNSTGRITGAVAAMAVAGLLAWSTGLVTAQASAPASAVRGAPAAAGVTAPPAFTATPDKTFSAADAHQGVAVDAKFFYAVNNQSITKYDRRTGKAVLQFVSDDSGPIIHMDSATVVGDKLYVATSDYDSAPEESSVEIFDTRTMRHIGTHSFGIFRGSLTWLDRHDGAWYGGFANYDEVPDGQTQPYGGTDNTQIVKMDDAFQVQQAWGVPHEILDRFKPMSNSGGSWGPDGRLWITGHGLDEAYVTELPDAGSDLRWIATVRLPQVEGQAIAWDRSRGADPTLWAIKRSTSQVLTFTVPYRSIKEPHTSSFHVYGPGQIQQ